ncbi:MAG: glycoside hydrolase family 13 protein [Lachnospiraceae bacterium]|nr:glycoside hydrolase family 13 protein [Lachnospiraceae bacterium]
MDFAAIYHRTSEQMSYPLNEEDLIINLRTGKDVTAVFLVHGDPFAAGILGGAERWDGTREKIYFKKELKNHIWWTTTVKPEYKRCKYYFELHAGKEVWYYFEDGFLTKEQMELPGKMLQYFIVPWMNPADVNRTPDWVNDTVWYQIFPDRFCRGKDSKEDQAVLPWRTGAVKNEERFGGNLSGMTEKLPYLKELGITGIYLTPICQAESNHKYDTTDYEKIDPGFGSEEDMKKFVHTAHEHGIRVMMDGVFNHSGRKFAPWLDVLEKGPESKYYHWFMINEWPVRMDRDTRDGRFYSFAFHEGMPKLNTNHEEVIAYIEKICTGWVKRFDIDGIRFDVGNEVSHLLLKRLRRTLKGLKPDFYLLGEIWHDASQWLLGDEYDAVMNYPLTSGINDFFIDKSLTKRDFAWRINACYTMYQQQNNNVLFNLLDSHDTDRLITRVGGNQDVFLQEMAALFTMPGSVCIFYGTEVALEGGHDPDCRRCMPWDELMTEENEKISGKIKALIRLRKEEDTFRSLYFHFPNEISEKRCAEYIKLDDSGKRIQILLNGETEPVQVGEEGEVLFSNGFKNGVLLPNGTLIRRKAP